MTLTKQAPSQEASSESALRLGRKLRESLIRDIRSALSDSQGVLITKVERVPTRDLNRLRHSLAGMASSFLVIKNSLGRAAFRQIGWPDAETLLQGTCGVSPIRQEVGPLARALTEFSKDHEGFIVLGGYLQGKPLMKQEIQSIAKLPSRQVLLGQLATVCTWPLSNLALVLSAPLKSLASVLQSVSHRKS